jgi:hypothetical protein
MARTRTEYWIAIGALLALSVAVWGFKAMTDEQRRKVFGG